ncbi:N-acetylneuraminate synthase [Cyclobacteriaceae bacterium]|nr:N-acetylneuraminate synthase [Cyclobacteriaceae bacterium]MDB4316213.1 N-acetylneuraminate synthase [Cyclobacteriaceae bacterium]MDB4605750.1 N-acetylneuraminate synthase [Cyclobacteriaceae bacterium]MDB4742820.1 N-acetylneuraminate synthase [Cyclobacteriaceae bacterium]
MANKVIIIAEAGVNHNGDINLAKKLIEEAAHSGADYVKFQTFKAKNLVSKTARKADYQVKNTNGGDDSQFQMLKNLEMPSEWHFELKDYAEKLGIKFLSTGFDEEAIDFLNKLGVDLFKIPSGEITNKPYLIDVAEKGKPIILSTGMATLEEVIAAVDVLVAHGITKKMITVLHCNTEYPTPMQDVNLLAMHHIKSQLGVEVGYSDHTLGIEVAVAAVALGARVIEKHFTLDKNMVGPDHLASLEPKKLKMMVQSIRDVELAISGSGFKEPSESEKSNIAVVRKSLHFKKKFKKGHIIVEGDFITLRPGSGISPMLIDSYLGKRLNKEVEAFSIIENGHFI